MLRINRETKQKTLEDIAAAFGDKVVLLTERDFEVGKKGLEIESGSKAEHFEMAGEGRV